MPPRLSVCLLTWNEAANLERAVRSVEGVADEVVVADAGSTDGTPRLARSLGAKVVPHSWTEDFSAGRNTAIEQAQGDWILWLNPDEELAPATRDLLRGLLANESELAREIFGYLVKIQSLPRAERPEAFSESWDLRLFRREPDVRYVGRLHPGLTPSGGTPRSVAPSDVILRHHAYLSTVTPARLRWSARLLEKELADRPGRPHYLVEYAQTLLMLEDPKGHEVMAEAVAWVAASAEAPTPPAPDAQRVLEYVLTTGAGRAGLALTPEQAEALAMRWFASSPPLLWAIAGRYFHARRFHSAAVLLDQLIRLGYNSGYDRTFPFDPRLVGPWPTINLAQCLRAVGRPDEARRLLTPLLADPEFQPRAAEILSDMDKDRPAPTSTPTPPA